MKNLFKKALKITIICSLLVFSSCEKDLYEESLQNSSRDISVKHVSLSNLDKITSSKINEKISLEEFMNSIENTSTDKVKGRAGEITAKLKEFMKTIPDSEKKSGILMNFLADAAVDYRAVFEVSKYCRQVGFENILFVAQGEK